MQVSDTPVERLLPKERRRTAQFAKSSAYVWLLTSIVATFCAWVLSLPLFPTQDGPMHLYFMHVLQSLLTDPHGFYAHYYFVRHLAPPYALYYYALMLLSTVLPVLLADKIIICLYFISFAFGFRYLARALGPNGEVMALLSTVLLLNWPLGMGFVNFCLSTSFALWALGLWCRAAGRQDTPRKVGFAALAYVIMFTHPVPLLGIGGFCAVELGIRLYHFRASRPMRASASFPPFWIADAMYLVVALGTLAYVKLFTVANLLHQVHLSHEDALHHELSLLKGYVLLHSLTAFAGRSLMDTAYRIIFYGLLAACLWLALRQYSRSRKSAEYVSGRRSIVEAWTFVSVFFLLGFVFIPSDLNNSAYFSARLVIFIWIAAMVAASAARFDHPAVRPALAGFAVISAALTLFLAHQRINPIARQIATIEELAPIPQNSIALLLHDPAYQLPSTTTYDPYFWSGVRMFRRTDTLMYNTPWLDLPIIPLGPQAFLPTGTLSPNDLEYPPGLRELMTRAPDVRKYVLSHVNLTLVSSGRREAGPTPDALLNSSPGSSSAALWSCFAEGTYSICSIGNVAVRNGIGDHRSNLATVALR